MKFFSIMSGKVSHHFKIKSELNQIFLAGLNAVKPRILIQNKIKIIGNNLHVNEKSLRLNEKVYLIGFGKAVMGMAMELEKLLEKRLMKGIISVPKGSINESLNYQDLSPSESRGVVTFRENCVNNVADTETLKVTREIMALAESLVQDDTLIVLISGGGSALLAMPKPPLTLGEKNKTWKDLQNVGADIKEVNVIRQRLSLIKAGGLAQLAAPARLISLVLSDVVGDPIELIAGGPTCYSPPEPSRVSAILKKYNLHDKLDEKIKSSLLRNESTDYRDFSHVSNFIIGNNSSATDAAMAEAVGRGLNAVILFNDVQGLVQNVSRMYVGLARIFCGLLNQSIGKNELVEFLKSWECLSSGNLEERIDAVLEMLENNDGKGFVLIGGGEPTVEVRGKGRGGRNQELALLFSRDWSQESSDDERLKQFDVMLLSAGTDGQDGPTDAAGAFGYAEIGENVNVESFLVDNNSYEFYSNFEEGRDLLKTGFTGTNVMDLHFLYIKKK